MRRLILFMVLIFVSSTVTAGGGKVGFSYLKIGVDARAAAMGDAYTSLTNDAAAGYWNPAGLAAAESHSIVLTHNAWLQGINHDFAAVQLFQGHHNIALSLNMISVSGILLRGERATEIPDGETSARNLYLGVSYASTFYKTWKIGLQVKYLYEKYYLYAAEGFAFDLGILNTDLFHDITLGAVIQNIGKMSALRSEETQLPIIFRTGLSYTLPWQLLENRPQVAADFVYVKDDVMHVNLGLNAGILKNFQLRLGYVVGRDSYNFTTGFGVVFKRYNFSYAFVPYQYDLGSTHRFSILIDF